MRNWYNRRMDKFEYIGLPPGEERSKLYLERMHDLSAQIIINDTGNLNGPSNQHTCTVIERSDDPVPDDISYSELVIKVVDLGIVFEEKRQNGTIRRSRLTTTPEGVKSLLMSDIVESRQAKVLRSTHDGSMGDKLRAAARANNDEPDETMHNASDAEITGLYEILEQISMGDAYSNASIGSTMRGINSFVSDWRGGPEMVQDSRQPGFMKLVRDALHRFRGRQ